VYSVKTETKSEKNILTVEEVAALLSMSVSGVYHWVAAKRIPYIRMGRFCRFDRLEIEKWLEENKVGAKI
jgi:excisionase family DNA binding protein